MFSFHQPELKESVSKFMAYVHTTVNMMSKEYLVNDRRYNYTTPKSFLEHIKLYRSLLDLKSRELTSKVERLENGLQKLNSTTAQVRTSAEPGGRGSGTPRRLSVTLFFSILLHLLIFSDRWTTSKLNWLLRKWN